MLLIVLCYVVLLKKSKLLSKLTQLNIIGKHNMPYVHTLGFTEEFTDSKKELVVLENKPERSLD